MGRNKEMNEKMKDQRREQIFSSALKLFATRGLAATKISDIAADANFSQGLVYHYFKSKEEIFIDLIKMAFEKLNTAARQLAAFDLPPLKKIRLAYTSLMKGLITSEDASLTHLLIATSAASTSIPEEARKIFDREHAVPYEIMQKIIEKGQQEGTIIQTDAYQLSLLFWSTIRGLSIYRALYQDTFIIPDVEIVLQMFIKKEK